MGKVKTSSSHLKSTRDQSLPYQNRFSGGKQSHNRYEYDSKYRYPASITRMVKSQQTEGYQQENKVIKKMSDRHSKRVDLDFFLENSLSYQYRREYPSSFSQESINVLNTSHERFINVILNDRKILIDILTEDINEAKGNITLFLELSLITNIVDNKNTIASFISRFRTFINDILHINKDIPWFNSIKELLIKEGDSSNTIITVEHVYQAICRANNVANQQEILVENSLSLDIKDYPETNDFISNQLATIEDDNEQMTSKDIAVFLIDKYLNVLDISKKKQIIIELAFFLNRSEGKLFKSHYLIQFYLSFLNEIIQEKELNGKSLQEIYNGVSEFFSKFQLVVTSKQVESILSHYGKVNIALEIS